jgi:adenylosuccinate lyase
MDELLSTTSLDGRYKSKISELSDYFSEYALIRYRVFVEIKYLLELYKEKILGLSQKDRDLLNGIINNFTLKDAQRVKEIEKTTNHDVKAVEYFLREKLPRELHQWIHFGLTSEDTNNLSYGLILKHAIKTVIYLALMNVEKSLLDFSDKYSDTVMLARTHGQPAVPTTMGKEFAVYAFRLKEQLLELKKFKPVGKLNGAVGNYNSFVAAYPGKNWISFSKNFVSRLELEPLLITTQIEPHDRMAKLCDIMSRINTILLDLCKDIWMYISFNYIIQSAAKDEVGSSTMPQKVNPIDFENCEGNLGLANSIFRHFSEKLPQSRMQRDLSDSTVQRNFGTAFGYSLLAYKSLLKGLSKINANEVLMKSDLENHPEVISEGIQTILRREGFSDAYETMKAMTRGKSITKKNIENFVKNLSVKKDAKKELLKLTPLTYTGLSSKLTKMVVKECKTDLGMSDKK